RFQADETGTEQVLEKRFMVALCKDLQEPMHAICGYAGMIEEQGQSFSEEDILDDAQSIRIAAELASDLLSDLQVICNMESGTVKMQPQRISAAELVADLELEIHNRFGLTDCQIASPEDLHLVGLKTDPAWARQAVIFAIKT